jgi:hypothetical protein
MCDRRYLTELGGAMLLYIVLLFGVKWIDRIMHPIGAARIALALVPMIACAAAVFAILRGIRRLDEFQRQIQFEALAFAFAVTAFGTFGWGFIEGAGAPKLPTFGVWPIMAISWIVGKALADRRYR